MTPQSEQNTQTDSPFAAEVVELAGKLYHYDFVSETNDQLHQVLQTAFAEHDRKLRSEYLDALRVGLDANAAYECMRDVMLEAVNVGSVGRAGQIDDQKLAVVLVDNRTVCVPSNVASEILKLREKLRMIRSFANE